MVRGTASGAHRREGLGGPGVGFAQEALAAMIDFVFDDMGLHRVRATHAPTNTRCARLLRHLGFEVEGHARDHLWVGEQRTDRLLCALINPAHTTV